MLLLVHTWLKNDRDFLLSAVCVFLKSHSISSMFHRTLLDPQLSSHFSTSFRTPAPDSSRTPCTWFQISYRSIWRYCHLIVTYIFIIIFTIFRTFEFKTYHSVIFVRLNSTVHQDGVDSLEVKIQYNINRRSSESVRSKISSIFL